MTKEVGVAPSVGQVWRDLDPRGGPTFRIVGFEYQADHMRSYAVVTDMKGKRKRRIRADRFRRYELLTNCEDICLDECQGPCGV